MMVLTLCASLCSLVCDIAHFTECKCWNVNVVRWLIKFSDIYRICWILFLIKVILVFEKYLYIVLTWLGFSGAGMLHVFP